MQRRVGARLHVAVRNLDLEGAEGVGGRLADELRRVVGGDGAVVGDVERLRDVGGEDVQRAKVKSAGADLNLRTNRVAREDDAVGRGLGS